MAHGMGAQKDIGLPKYAEQFAAEGTAVLVFDYRTFGGSDGEPRHWVNPYKHLADWWAVVGHVKVGWLLRIAWHGDSCMQQHRYGVGVLYRGAGIAPRMLQVIVCSVHAVPCAQTRQMPLSAGVCCKIQSHSFASDSLPHLVRLQDTELNGTVDSSRLALWGVSYAGGHALMTAARLGDNVSAIIANVG